jgi:hypothetical protein
MEDDGVVARSGTVHRTSAGRSAAATSIVMLMRECTADGREAQRASRDRNDDQRSGYQYRHDCLQWRVLEPPFTGSGITMHTASRGLNFTM